MKNYHQNYLVISFHLLDKYIHFTLK